MPCAYYVNVCTYVRSQIWWPFLPRLSVIQHPYRFESEVPRLNFIVKNSGCKVSLPVLNVHLTAAPRSLYLLRLPPHPFLARCTPVMCAGGTVGQHIQSRDPRRDRQEHVQPCGPGLACAVAPPAQGQDGQGKASPAQAVITFIGS